MSKVPAEVTDESTAVAKQHDKTPVKDPVPSGTWDMVRKLLGRLGQREELARAEVQAATIIYLKDEASRNNRMGGSLTSVGGLLAAGGGAWTLFAAEIEFSTIVAVVGLAAIAVGQFVKLYGAHREGVGPMVAAIIEHRQCNKEENPQ